MRFELVYLDLNINLNTFITMKKVLLLALMMAFVASVNSYASTSQYRVDDTAVDVVFDQSINVAVTYSDIDYMDATTVQAGDVNPWVAFVLAFVVGWTGAHRVYMGGKGILIAAYVLTCGGIFGIVPFVDWIVLLIGAANDDISKYIDNDKFFMW